MGIQNTYRTIAIAEAAVIVIMLVFFVLLPALGGPMGSPYGGPGGDFGAGTPLPESSGIPEYEGANTVPFSEEARVGFNIQEDVDAYGYMTTDSPADVMNWYKNNMGEWSLEAEDSISSPEGEIPMQYYRQDENGTFIFSVGISAGETFIGIAIGSWDSVQDCGPSGPDSGPDGGESGPSEAMEALGIPLYEGAQTVPLPDSTKEDLGIPENATMDGYTTPVSNSPLNVTEWYKDNMPGWSLEDEIALSGEPAMYMLYFKKDNNGAFIMSTLITEPDETIIIISTGEWDIIQQCGPDTGG